MCVTSSPWVAVIGSCSDVNVCFLTSYGQWVGVVVMGVVSVASQDSRGMGVVSATSQDGRGNGSGFSDVTGEWVWFLRRHRGNGCVFSDVRG